MTSSGTIPVAVLGAGAVGCYFGGMLARAGHRVTLIGRRAHVDAFRQSGLHFEGLRFDEHVPVEASTDPSAVRGARLVLFCVKSIDTEHAAEQIAPHLDPAAIIVNLQNGVDNTERIRARVPCPVIPAVVYVATEMKGPGHLKHHGRGDLVIGSLNGHSARDSNEKIKAWFTERASNHLILIGYFLGLILSLTHFTASSIGVPGVKMALTPAWVRAGMSSSGTIPPPKTIISSAPFSLRSSITLGKR